ncbi:hypothetical protein ACPXCG_11890 [Gordonia sp. DT218]|uniref:hypothetical protein n=1 Tax=unclassified Gordonia (in: high G+C Gram-positive bacteria) TaxID=2657482 RepID=UPI003CF57967
MINNDFQRGALGFSRGMTIVGSVILMVCVALLTVNWWREGRWLWVVIGIAIVVVNIGLIFLQFRRRKLTPPPRPNATDPDD